MVGSYFLSINRLQPKYLQLGTAKIQRYETCAMRRFLTDICVFLIWAYFARAELTE
jgi:hypothetical protein